MKTPLATTPSQTPDEDGCLSVFEMCCGGSNAPILDAILDNPEADRANSEEAIARAIARGLSVEEAHALYGGSSTTS